MKRFFSGTSNMVLPVKNKSFFPKEFLHKTRLAYYAHLFNSVEINASFYKVPLARTVAKWDSEVSDDFRFSYKLIKHVTHGQRQALDINPIHGFLSHVNASNKRGCLLIQFPPKFYADAAQLELLLIATSNSGWGTAVEFRHAGWYQDNIFPLLNTYNAAMVIHDMPKSRAPFELISNHFVCLRFHGPENVYRGSYEDAIMHEYAEYIGEWLNEEKTGYCYFNNTLGAVVQNLETINRYVGVRRSATLTG